MIFRELFSSVKFSECVSSLSLDLVNSVFSIFANSSHTNILYVVFCLSSFPPKTSNPSDKSFFTNSCTFLVSLISS